MGHGKDSRAPRSYGLMLYARTSTDDTRHRGRAGSLGCAHIVYGEHQPSIRNLNLAYASLKPMNSTSTLLKVFSLPHSPALFLGKKT